VCATRRCASKGEALRLEHALKQLPRTQKQSLTRARLHAFARRRARGET
jgi:predicted GIY-YIG superfamily endonuclease